jgi:hypothetical protein
MMIEKGRGDTTQGTVDGTAKIATSTASYRGMVATLTTANAKLASQLEAAQLYIKTLKDGIISLNTKIKPAWQGQRRSIMNSIYIDCNKHVIDKVMCLYKRP